MQTRIRRTLIALVASLSVAATMAPATQAMKNDGRFQDSIEGQRQQDSWVCDWWETRYHEEVQYMVEAWAKGNKQSMEWHASLVDRYLALGKQDGCAWAS
jgi:Ni/Co efflux regulator RcnB